MDPNSISISSTIMDPSQQDAMDVTPDPMSQNQHYIHHDEHAYNGNPYQTRPMTSQSADVTYSPHMDVNNSPNLSHQSAAGMQASRPPSGLSDTTSRQAASYDPRSQTNGQEKTIFAFSPLLKSRFLELRSGWTAKKPK